MKESIKKFLPFLVPIYQKMREFRKSLKNEEEIFTEIFEKNLWKDDQSASGTGSNLAATEQIRDLLPKLFDKYKIRTFLDAPCGDFLWMNEVSLNKISYTGADIVKEIIEYNQKQYSIKGEFITLNLINDHLKTYDLIMCRECLVHLNNDQIHQTLLNITNSNSKWLLTTTYPDQKENIDIVTGQWRAINLCLPPYNLPKPIEIFDDTDSVPGIYPKKIALWNIETLKGSLHGCD